MMRCLPFELSWNHDRWQLSSDFFAGKPVKPRLAFEIAFNPIKTEIQAAGEARRRSIYAQNGGIPQPSRTPWRWEGLDPFDVYLNAFDDWDGSSEHVGTHKEDCDCPVCVPDEYHPTDCPCPVCDPSLAFCEMRVERQPSPDYDGPMASAVPQLDGAISESSQGIEQRAPHHSTPLNMRTGNNVRETSMVLGPTGLTTEPAGLGLPLVIRRFDALDARANHSRFTRQFHDTNRGVSQKDKPKYEPPPQPTTRIGRKKRKQGGPNASAKLPTIYPTARCKLRYLRMQRVHDHLLLEEEYVENQERIRKAKSAQTQAPSSTMEGEGMDRNADERSRVDDMRGSPMGVGNLEELIDDDHAIVSSATGPEYYVSIMSFVDKDLLEPGASILLHHKSNSVVGVLTDDADPLVNVMKLDKAPTESYADIGGLEQQIQEVREAVELPLLHPELYEEMGIKPPKGVILYGAPGTGKTLLAKAVANQTSATFLRIVGSELIQKYLGDGPRLVRQLFQVAAENAPSIVFIDEIDAIGMASPSALFFR